MMRPWDAPAWLWSRGDGQPEIADHSIRRWIWRALGLASAWVLIGVVAMLLSL